MDASLLPAFHDVLVVAQTGSVGEAARRLHKTASAVSQQIRRIEAPGEAVNFQLPFGEWIALFRRCGFAVEDLIELRPPADATSSYRTEQDREWARRWPLEQIWRVRREGGGAPA